MQIQDREKKKKKKIMSPQGGIWDVDIVAVSEAVGQSVAAWKRIPGKALHLAVQAHLISQGHRPADPQWNELNQANCIAPWPPWAALSREQQAPSQSNSILDQWGPINPGLTDIMERVHLLIPLYVTYIQQI